MAAVFKDLHSFSSQFAEAANVLGSQLGVLQAHKDDFAKYISSLGAGNAAQAATQNALDKGNKLKDITNQISQALGNAGTKTTAQDQQAPTRIKASMPNM